MLLGHIVEEAVTSIWMERPHPTDGMAKGAAEWAPGHESETMEIDSLDTLNDWLRSLMRPIVDRMIEELNGAWSNCLWKAEGRSAGEVKREKLNSMIKNAIKLQMCEATACLEANGGPHLEAFREHGDPFGTPAPCWGDGKGTGWQSAGESCTWWEAWEIARPWVKDSRILVAQRLFHEDGWAAGELDVAHRWRGNIHIIDIKANRGTGRDHSGVAHQLRFYQWLWNETRNHTNKPDNQVEEGNVVEANSWHLADGFVHKADLIEDLESETVRLRAIHNEMAKTSLDDLKLSGTLPSTEGELGCEICHGLQTCDYPRGGREQPLHSLIPDVEIQPADSPYTAIADLPSRVTVKGSLHGHWGPMANHYGDHIIGAAITAGGKTAVIEEMGVDQFPRLHDFEGAVVVVNAAPGQWRGMIRLYLDSESQIIPMSEVGGDMEIDRLGLIPTRANISGVVISRGSNSGTNAKGKDWSMATAHIWDGTALTEVVAFGRGRSDSFDKLRVGDRILLMAAEIGWREGTPQLRIDPRNTRMTIDSKPPELSD